MRDLPRFVLVATIVCGLTACGGGDGGKGGGTTGAASAPAGDASGDAASKALEKAGEIATDPNVQGCIAKVQAGDLREAYPICLEAAKVAPDNPEVQAALAKSKDAHAAVADAGEQAAEAQKAAEDAQKAADAAKGMKPPGF